MILTTDQIEPQRRWNITQALRDEVIERLMEIVRGASQVHAIRAAKVLLEMDEQNITAERMHEEFREQCLTILRQREAS